MSGTTKMLSQVETTSDEFCPRIHTYLLRSQLRRSCSHRDAAPEESRQSDGKNFHVVAVAVSVLPLR